MEGIFYRYNPWWEGKTFFEGAIERRGPMEAIQRQLRSRQIVFLTGIRRAGKTTLLKLLINRLIEKEGVRPSHIFYVSLDDYLLSKKSILELVEEYRKIQRLSIKEKVFLFFDEITYKDAFEQQLKNLYDGQDAKIYASSSSSSILKSKKPYLTGRSTIIEVLPLDFQEYLLFKNIVLSKADSHLTGKYFEDYLQTGGMPEYVLRGDLEYLKELVDDIIHKDIAVFHGVRNPQILKDFFLLLMERAGKSASINKMANILKISPDTANRYLHMFADTYLIYLVPRCGKTNERVLSPKKVYAADLGIRTLFTGFRDLGSLFENYVYMKIKSLNPCYVYEDSAEIDFLTAEGTLLEVKYNSKLSDAQKRLFESHPANKKIVINGPGDLVHLNVV